MNSARERIALRLIGQLDTLQQGRLLDALRCLHDGGHFSLYIIGVEEGTVYRNPIGFNYHCNK